MAWPNVIVLRLFVKYSGLPVNKYIISMYIYSQTCLKRRSLVRNKIVWLKHTALTDSEGYFQEQNHRLHKTDNCLIIKLLDKYLLTPIV